MNTTKLIIYRYPNIYEILKELNDVLKFDLVQIDKETDLKSSLNNIENYLVVAKKIPFKDANVLIVKDFPIKIDKLIEKINLKILKNSFNLRSKISIGKYSLDDNSRKISYKDLEANLTEQEVKVLLYLKKLKRPVNVGDLQKHIWGYNLDLETHTVETHIYRLRQKFSKIFNDNNLIKSSKKGYLIE